MALKIKFEKYGDNIVYNPQPPTFVLMSRSGKKFGVINPVDEKVRCYLNSADEISFQVYREIEGKYVFHSRPNPPYHFGDIYEYDGDASAVVGIAITGRAIVGVRKFKYVCVNSREEGTYHEEDWVEASIVPADIWNDITNFKLLWCKEWNQLFEIYVDVDDGDGVSKFVTGTALGEAELGQIMLYDIQINTEDDIARDDYKPTVFYDPFDPEASLLHRITDKAPHYEFGSIDASLMHIQRTFEFNGKSLYDAFQEISEEIGCLFEFNCYLDENMEIVREINVHDMESTCNVCGYRNDFWDVCPKCGSTDVENGYGEDTGIFFSVDNLTDDVRYSTDTGAVKNCFKLVAGDDVITAAIRSVNPSGSDYIYYMSDETKADMSEELVTKLNDYDDLYDYYYKDYAYSTTSFNAQYNTIVNKYNTAYQTDYQTIPNTLVGYPSISEAYYYAEDFYCYLNDELLPTVSMSDTSAAIEAAKLTAQALSPVAVTNLSVASQQTVENAVLGMAKVIVDARYKTTIHTTSYANYVWRGNFTVENYSDEEDIADSSTINVTINGDYETFVKQKINKELERRMLQTDAQTNIVDLFNLDLTHFNAELKKYSLSGLKGLYESCQTVIDVLIEQGIANHTSWAGETRDLYEILYVPYRNKLRAIEAETAVRTSEIDTVTTTIDTLLAKMRAIQATLDLHDYIGESLWLEFVSFRREDEYQNSNYVSDGLSNAEVIEKAIEFVEVARRDIVRSATLQHSISSTLANLLVMKEFQSIVNKFENGNWIRCRVADDVFRLRLIDYELEYSNIDKLSVSFSDVMRHIAGITDLAQIVKQSQSMATSYSHVTRQALDGGKASKRMAGWVRDGLSLTTMKIVNAADRQDISWDDRGMLARRYDDITETYDEKQLKIINNGLYVTNDDWNTSKAGIGEFTFFNPRTQQTETQYGVIADYLVGSYILGEDAFISNQDASVSLDNDGIAVEGQHNTVLINPNATYLMDVKKGNDHLLYLDGSGNLNLTGAITATALTLGNNVTIPASKVSGLPDVTIYVAKDGTIGQTPGEGKTGFVVSSAGLLQASNAIIYGTLYSSAGKIAGWDLKSTAIYHGTNSMTSTTAGLYLGTDGIRNYKNSSTYVNITDGVITAQGASISGAITATSLTLGSGVSVAAGKVSGLATVATSGSYSDLSGKPSLTVYVQKDGTIGSTPASGKNGFVVSSAGLLQASNAIIWGTIYASAGTIGGFTTESNTIHTAGVAITSNANDSVGLASNTFTRTIGGTSRSGLKFAIGGNFGVNSSGTVYAHSLTATGGTIGGWTIGSSSIYSNPTSTRYVYLGNGTNGNADVLVVRNGTEGSYSYPVVIRADGTFAATKATITGSATITGGSVNITSSSESDSRIKLAYTFTSSSSGKSVTLSNEIKARGLYVYSSEIPGGAASGNTATAYAYYQGHLCTGYVNGNQTWWMGTYYQSGGYWTNLYMKAARTTTTVFICGENDNSGGGVYCNNSSGTRTAYINGATGRMYANGYDTPSDIRLKQDIEYMDIDERADFTYKLKPVSFKYISEPDAIHHGLIYQDAVKCVKDRRWSFLGQIESGKRDETETDTLDRPYKTLSYTELIADLIATAQSQNNRITTLENKITELMDMMSE